MATVNPDNVRQRHNRRVVAEALAGPIGHRARARMLVLLAAFLSFLLSVTLWFTGSTDEGLFVGIWVPTILSLGTFVLPREESR